MDSFKEVMEEVAKRDNLSIFNNLNIQNFISVASPASIKFSNWGKFFGLNILSFLVSERSVTIFPLFLEENNLYI